MLFLLCGLPLIVQAQNRPDLVIIAPFTVPTNVLAGASYPLSAVIKNQGTNGSQFNCIGYYLSTNNTWDATDAYLGSSCQSLLFPGQSGTCGITATIPALNSVGSRYILLVADPLNAEQESDETNNVVSFPVTVAAGGNVLPDLELWRPSISFAAVPPGGNTGAFTFIFNRGPAAVGAYEIGYYLSADTVFSAGTDVFLGLVPGSSLSMSGGTIHSAPVLTIPPTTSPGNYYLVFMADPRNVVAETNENNNSRALALRVTGTATATATAAERAIAIYPMPVARGEMLNIAAEAYRQQPVAVAVFDGLGRLVLHQAVAHALSTIQVDTKGLRAGIYSVRVSSGLGSITRRVVVE